MAILTSEKVNFRAKNTVSGKNVHLIMIGINVSKGGDNLKLIKEIYANIRNLRT